MAEARSIDPFVCSEPAVEVKLETSRILERRMKTADEGRFVAAEEARRRVHQRLAESYRNNADRPGVYPIRTRTVGARPA